MHSPSSVSRLPRGRSIPGVTLSQFDILKLHRLPNWGRWGRQDGDKPRDHVSLAGEFVGEDLRDGADADKAVSVPPPPIDWRDAELLDAHIVRMSGRHRAAIIARYYRQERVPRLELDWAIRMLQDAMGMLEAANELRANE